MDLVKLSVTGEAMTETMAQFCEGVVKDFEKSSELKPRVYVISNDGLFFYFDYPGSDDLDEVEKMQRIIIMIIVAQRVTGTLKGVGMVGEAWTSSLAVGEKRKYASCADDPNRGEVLFYYCYEADGTKTSKAWDIIREGKNVRTEPKGVDGGQQYGWIDRAFMPIGNPTQVVIDEAREFLSHLKTNKRP